MPELIIVAVIAAIAGGTVGFFARQFVATNAVKHAEQYTCLLYTSDAADE